MKEFYTRETANNGVKLPLFHPDGTTSKHWLKVLGIDSDEFRRVEAQSKRKAMELALIDDVQERALRVREIELECVACLIADWSFPQECTADNVVTFLREAPQIADKVNQFSARRTEFFSKKSISSAPGPKRKSTSVSRRKVQK